MEMRKQVNDCQFGELKEMRKQVNDCQFGELKDDLMLRVLIRGVDSDRMRRRLFETKRLDLISAIRMCQAMESTASDLQLLTATKPTESEAALGVKELGVKDCEERKLQQEGFKREDPTKRGYNRGARWGPGDRVCSRCGLSHRPRQCPAYGKKCAKCKGPNHFARMCSSGRPTHLVEEDMTRSGSDDDYVCLIAVEKVGKKFLAKVPFRVKGRTQTIVCQLDAAASCNVLAASDYRRLGSPGLQKSQPILPLTVMILAISLVSLNVLTHRIVLLAPCSQCSEDITENSPQIVGLHPFTCLSRLCHLSDSLLVEAIQDFDKKLIAHEILDANPHPSEVVNTGNNGEPMSPSHDAIPIGYPLTKHGLCPFSCLPHFQKSIQDIDRVPQNFEHLNGYYHKCAENAQT